MENAIVIKKNLQILNKILTVIGFLLIVLSSHAQKANGDPKKQVWKQEKDYLKYKKQRDYKGPEDWYGSGPSSLNESDDSYTGSPSSSQGLQYNPKQIQQDRERQFGRDPGTGGTLDSDPKIKKPDPITLPDVKSPDIDGPDLSNTKAPVIPPVVWKVLLFILIIVVVVWAVYYWLKNKQPGEQKILQNVENDWNPSVISKTELELKLEESMLKEDYRECVRIYFTFILKELIRRNWIQWKKDKTNHDYVLETIGKPNESLFRECVRIYDIVWYGEYEITKEAFELLQPSLLNYYHYLKVANE